MLFTSHVQAPKRSSEPWRVTMPPHGAVHLRDDPDASDKSQRIYLDYDTSTPIGPIVFAMKPFLEDHYGSPSSRRWAATTAKNGIETACGRVSVERPQIIEPCRFLERLSARVTYLPVGSTGRVDSGDLRDARIRSTIPVSIKHANRAQNSPYRAATAERRPYHYGVRQLENGRDIIGTRGEHLPTRR